MSTAGRRGVDEQTAHRIRIRLAGRRQVAGTVIGVVRAAMDVELGIPVAELHCARPGSEGRREVVRAGQIIRTGDTALRVEEIHPYNGRTPAGVVLGAVPRGADVSETLG